MILRPLITEDNKKLFWAFGLVAGSWLICLLVSGVLLLINAKQVKKNELTVPAEELKQFASETEFRNYFLETNTRSAMTNDVMVGQALSKTAIPTELSTNETAVTPERMSETNVQVQGIDEPDIVKTDGKQIYVSSEGIVLSKMKRATATSEPSILPIPPLNETATQIIQALPVEAIKRIGTIDAGGQLLLSGNILIVINGQNLTGFNASQPDFPELWHYTVADNQSVNSIRLVDGKVILVATSRVNAAIPCPIPLLGGTKKTLTVSCTDIWRPASPIPVDSTYTILQLDPVNGDIKNQTSFVGASGQTVVFVSSSSVYISFTRGVDWGKLTADFFLDDNDKLVTVAVKDHIRRVMTLDISDAAKQVELDLILRQYTAGMNDDDRMRWETERNNVMTAYIDLHKRELERTYIAKVPLNDFKISAIGEVPGRPLNQFSLDEYQGTFRIATTVGGRSVGGSVKSANDVYILDAEMKAVGSVLDLGKEERIYAVRFVGSRGYVVTFKETDPLYVIDLSNSKAPLLAGELKIPGYSSYLHPLGDTLLVGIGKEDAHVKVSLFDVSNATKPTEVGTYVLTDYWSSILSTHHAFLQDAKHAVFFMPGDKGGYIFGYENGKLTLIKTIADAGIQRALYINDNLYLVGEHKLTVVSEADWKTLKTAEW